MAVPAPAEAAPLLPAPAVVLPLVELPLEEFAAGATAPEPPPKALLPAPPLAPVPEPFGSAVEALSWGPQAPASNTSDIARHTREDF
ncbi:MAG TPA: hypothetical protein VHU80_24710 [Polyangiaceae bacterium]|nr:hypothetical protein [Polyangiaceae bacterium]